MGEKSLSTKVRDLIKGMFKKRQDNARGKSKARFKAVPRKPRLSTRGQPGDTWNTKRWTRARIQMRDEAFEARAAERQRVMELDRAAKAKDKATHIERH